MADFPPTSEQGAVVAVFAAGDDVAMQARAGSGKTSTLRLLAEAHPGKRMIYLAYNKAIAADAKASMPRTVQAATAHSVAFKAVMTDWMRGRLFGGARQPARQVAEILGIRAPLDLGTDTPTLSPQQQARAVTAAVTRFCYSADIVPDARHIHVRGFEAPAHRAAVGAALEPYALRAWEDITSPLGKLKFEHDHYLTIWALSHPQLDVDTVLADEWQDANPRMAALVAGQWCQRVAVGDTAQAIYGWRGARDALTGFPGVHLTLSQSFRFGEAVAGEANKWLGLLGETPKVHGFDRIDSVVAGGVERPDAVLCRSNAGAVTEAIHAMRGGRTAALVGGGADAKRLAQAAEALMAGRVTEHPELYAFSSWDEVRQYAEEDPSGSDLRVLVRLIDTYTPAGVVKVVDGLVDETAADVVISTAHKAKGREWDTVRVSDDFQAPKPDAEVSDDEAMLAYVTVTRAKRRLDRGSLAYVDRLAVA